MITKTITCDSCDATTAQRRGELKKKHFLKQSSVSEREVLTSSDIEETHHFSFRFHLILFSWSP